MNSFRRIRWSIKRLDGRRLTWSRIAYQRGPYGSSSSVWESVAPDDVPAEYEVTNRPRLDLGRRGRVGRQWGPGPARRRREDPPGRRHGLLCMAMSRRTYLPARAAGLAELDPRSTRAGLLLPGN